MLDNQFIEKGFKSSAGRLSEKEYAKMLDNLVKATADIVIINSRGEMLLGKRAWQPAKGWWVIGGRMVPGERLEQAAARNVKKELGLEISPERFSYLGTYSFVWANRRQKPERNGTHDISITMVLLIDDKEAALIKPNDEYEEVRWRDPMLVINDENFLPPVRKIAEDILKVLEGMKK